MTTPADVREAGLVDEAHLAAAVLRSALEDLRSPYPGRQREAWLFFMKSDGLPFWCARLQLSPEAVREHLGDELAAVAANDSTVGSGGSIGATGRAHDDPGPREGK